jgi:hypothetical protein
MLFPQLHALVRRACLHLGGESAHEIRLIRIPSLMWKQREAFGIVMPLPVCAQGAGVQ